MGASRGRSEKNAIRVCGDWSEQLSSKGKIYFYNCITEVSQWQKPPEWKLPDMDHDELLRHLRAREQLDARSLKRPRVVGSSHANSVRESESDQRSASPKRAKYITEIRSRNPNQERKPSPITHSDPTINRSNCPAVTPKVCIPKRPNSRTSPRRTYDDRSHPDYRYSQTRRDASGSGNRLLPTDDMDISPNSSPMSGGSSPMHHSYHSQSASNRHARTGLAQNPPPDTIYTSAKTNQNQSEANISSSKSSGPLLQLVDALRASLGLFGDSPNPSGPKSGQERFPATNGASVPGRPAKFNHSSAFHDKEEKYRTPSYPAREGLVRPQCLPSPEVSLPTGAQRIPDRPMGDPSPRASVPNSNARNFAEIQRSHSADNSTKNISGIVSTLTTLVSLISNTKYAHPSANTSPSPAAPVHGPQSNYHRTPSHPYVTPQRTRPQMNSPVIPSPLTPSANTGTSSSGGSTSSRATHSILTSGCSLSSHQMDDLLSSLENLTQHARSGTSKLSGCYSNTSTRASVPEFSTLSEDRVAHPNRGLISPQGTRPYCSQPRSRERCNNVPCVPNLGEKFYRDSEQSNQTERINDLVKVLKSAVQQHLHVRSSVPSTGDSRNSALSHSLPVPIQDMSSIPDSSQSNKSASSFRESYHILPPTFPTDRNEHQCYGESPVSSSHPTVIGDRHLRPHSNGQIPQECDHEQSSSRFSTSGISPCHDGSAPCSTSVPLSAVPSQEVTLSRIPTPGEINPTSVLPVGVGHLEEQNSPVDRLLEEKCLSRVNKILGSAEAQQLLDSAITTKYVDKSVERLEHEAQIESKKFDQLQSVLYGELSVESKKLRALVRISEAKLAIHKEKQSALQALMDAIETRRHLPSLSFSDDVLGCSTLAGSL